MPPRFCAQARFLPFASLVFLSADNGAPAGGGSTQTKESAADISTLPKAKARVADLEKEVTSAENARDQALSAQKAAENERDQALQVGKDTAKQRDDARAELATANTTVGTLTAERDQARTGLQKEKTNVSRLETLCGLKGIDPNALPPVANEEKLEGGEALYEQFSKLTGAARTRFYRANSKALDAYADSQR